MLSRHEFLSRSRYSAAWRQRKECVLKNGCFWCMLYCFKPKWQEYITLSYSSSFILLFFIYWILVQGGRGFRNWLFLLYVLRFQIKMGRNTSPFLSSSSFIESRPGWQSLQTHVHDLSIWTSESWVLSYHRQILIYFSSWGLKEAKCWQWNPRGNSWQALFFLSGYIYIYIYIYIYTPLEKEKKKEKKRRRYGT